MSSEIAYEGNKNLEGRMAEWSNATGCKPVAERLRRFKSYSSQICGQVYGAVAQLARAPALHAGGQGFDSPRLQKLTV